MEINSFRGEAAFLSNFAFVNIEFDGLEFTSVEAAYQAMKCRTHEERVPFQRMTPAQAKAAGKRISIREDWIAVRLEIMLELVTLKFQTPRLRKLLLATGDAQLVEGNYWNDTFWGVCRGKGENHLGKILMLVRSRMQPTKKS